MRILSRVAKRTFLVRMKEMMRKRAKGDKQEESEEKFCGVCMRLDEREEKSCIILDISRVFAM
jgi:hypothetical protein